MTEFAFALEWEKLGNEGTDAGLVTERARVFGGWLVRVGHAPNAMALTFVPDGQGRWDGEDFGEDDYGRRRGRSVSTHFQRLWEGLQS